LMVVSLIDDSRNCEGLRAFNSSERSKLDTTNTHSAPVN
jgi:hypothetical protein